MTISNGGGGRCGVCARATRGMLPLATSGGEAHPWLKSLRVAEGVGKKILRGSRIRGGRRWCRLVVEGLPVVDAWHGADGKARGKLGFVKPFNQNDAVLKWEKFSPTSAKTTPFLGGGAGLPHAHGLGPIPTVHSAQ